MSITLKKTFQTLILGLFGFSLINGCQTAIKHHHSHELGKQALNATVTATFSPDGRLWRLIPTDDAVYIDSSENFGKTYSQPIRVNPIGQKINVWPENPAIVKISQSGRINVLYSADAQQKATSFFTFSDDNGVTFSNPVAISDHADKARNYMVKMLIDDSDRVYMFWHDLRHEQNKSQAQAGILSLYFTVTDAPPSGQFKNHLVSHSICSCCRTATALSPEGHPVILARMVFPGSIRDHTLIKMDKTGNWLAAQRVTEDNWKIEACPEHGPALSIDRHGRSHLAWFTLGANRKGIFYAQTDDYGKTLTEPMSLGNKNRLPGHPDVFATNKRVVLAWKEFDGHQSDILIKSSNNKGVNWTASEKIASATGKTGHPELISHGKKIFLSWSSAQQGHQLIEITP